MIIPTPATPVHEIPAQQREGLKVGEARRADILMRYGEPEVRIDADRVLVYQWNRIRAAVVAINLAGGPIYDVEALFLEFDARGILARTGMAVAWQRKTIAEQAREWSRGSPAVP